MVATAQDFQLPGPSVEHQFHGFCQEDFMGPQSDEKGVQTVTNSYTLVRTKIDMFRDTSFVFSLSLILSTMVSSYIVMVQNVVVQ